MNTQLAFTARPRVQTSPTSLFDFGSLLRAACLLAAGFGAAVIAHAQQTVVANYNGDSLYVLDLSTGDRTILSDVTTGTGSLFDRPIGIGREADGSILVGEDQTDARLIRVDPVTGNRTVVSHSTVGTGPALDYVRGLAIDASGNIIASSMQTHSIVRIDPVTGDRTELGSGSVGSGPALLSPWGVAVEPDGNIVVANFTSSELIRLNPTTGVRTVISGFGVGTGPALSNPSGIARLSDGAIAVVNITSADYILRVDPTTGNRTVMTGATAGTGPAINARYTVSYDTNGILYSADFSGGFVVRIDPANGDRTTIASGSVGTGPAFNGLIGILPYAVASVTPPPMPAITSAVTASGAYGTAFTYQVTATNTPTSYAATGLPTGLSIDTNTGIVSGTPTQTGAFTVALTATNSAGPGTQNITLTIAPASSTTALTTTPDPSVSGESVTIAASVAANAPATGMPTGTVTFTAPGGISQTVTLDPSAQASFTTTALATGTVTATYQGDGNFAGSTGATSVTVNRGSTTVALAAAANPIIFGGDVALTATVSVNPPASGTATGTVNFNNGTTLLGTVPLTNGSAAFTVTSPAGGSHSYSAVYSGDSSFDPATSQTLVVQVTPAAQTIGFAPIAQLIAGDVVPLSATASSGLGVTFSVVSGPASISGNTLTINEGGQIVVRAAQAGTANYAAASVDQTVEASKASQIITFATLPNRQATDEPFELVATASSALPVSFTVVSGPAMISGRTLTLTGAKGTVLVRASQPGNGAFLPAEDVVREFNVDSDGDRVFFGDFFNETAAPQNQAGAAALATATKIGEVAAVLPANGNDGFLLIVAESVGINELTSFTLNEDGSYTTTVTQQAGPNVPVARTLSVEGELSGGVLTGVIEDVGFGFSTAIESASGPSAELAGLYVSTSLNTAEGATYTIVGTDNNVLVLAVTPTLTTGGLATLQADGSFRVETISPSAQPVTITGAVHAPTSTVTGTIRVADENPVEFAGLESTTSRTDRLMGLSSRGRVGSGEKILISGVVIGGEEPKQVMIRAIGPALTSLGVANVLADPRISLFRGSTLIGENDNWATADNAEEIAETAERIGAFGLASGSKDATLLRTLQPGAYTVHIHGGEGVALAEIYDASENPQSEYQRLVDIATRGEVGTGENVLIGGLAISGNSPKRVLIRGVGPALTAQGVSGVLADPMVTVYRGNTVIGQNDNWSADATQASQITAAETTTGAFHLENGSKDAAILLTLAPGLYTVHVAGVNNTTGVALVEIYEVAE